MYLEHFNFTSRPFSIAPNPRFVYLSPQHQEALAHLLYGIRVGGGFVVLTGEVGTGKTTLCRCLLEQLPEDVDMALIFNPMLSERELLASICDELSIAHPASASVKVLIDRLNQFLLRAHAEGRRTVVLIDEAQNLRREVLEQIRLLTNLETDETKLLQIILVGQPELRDMLAEDRLRQLSQRVTARFHLEPLSRDDIRAYIQHRLAVSGVQRPIFSAGAIGRVYRYSRGIPRLINLICDRALLGAYTLGRSHVTPAIVGKAAREILAKPGVFARIVPSSRMLAGTAVMLAGLIGAGVWKLLDDGVPSWSRPGERAGESVVSLKPRADKASAPATPKVSAQTEPPAPAPANAAKLAHRLASLANDETHPLTVLLGLWGHTDRSVGDRCQIARQHGLRCFDFVGDWQSLVALGHPAVLEVHLPEGLPRSVALVRLEQGQPVLDLAGDRVVVSADELLPLWRGKARLLWKPPEGYAGAIERGRRGTTVRWLREKLGVEAPTGQDDQYDGYLEARIAAFQRERGLRPDGSAGPLTLISLNAQTADGPRLVAPSLSPHN
jgi:general secretion pathway protein A